MNAAEFQTTIYNGVITLPGNHKSWNGKKIKVILLDESGSDTTEASAKEATFDAEFFNGAGMWENRDDITQESIRTQACRANKR